MGKITHPLPSSLPLLENIVAVDEIGFGVVVEYDVDLEVAADSNADAGMPMLIYRCRDKNNRRNADGCSGALLSVANANR
jgi:hypothetical protein